MRDDRAIHRLLVTIGGLRVGLALVLDQRFGAEATVAGLMLLTGVIGWREG